ncbi:hypothetical protein [Sphaerisporangium corydalis]|uniref:Uncharacterized protein n=1 Tax=Sphaerisporangium corydalis TaxID=1441875 RepID=A0ABV9EM14_9ACTN|nr:hypothetical protein [Sphaerisporangium corydalis]
MGQNQRRAWWWRVKPYLNAGDRTSVAELEMEGDPYGGPVPSGPPPERDLKRLRAEARENGYRDGRSGMYDQWSLSTGSRPPYLMTLEAKREEVVAEEKVRSLRDLQRLEERIAVTKQDLNRCTEQVTSTKGEIEALTRQEKALQRLLGGEGPEGGTGAEGTAAQPGRRWAEPTRSLKRRLLAFVLRGVVLVLFAAVEIPIQYATFLFFGESPVMTLAFVAGTAGSMLVAPHLAGGWVRRMSVEGWRSPLLPGTVLVVAGWFTGVCLLAYLRTAVLFASIIDSETLLQVKSTIDTLQLGRVPVVVLFSALLTLSGVVTFTYGFLGENPYATKLADIQRERKKLEKVLAVLEGRRHRDEYLVSLAATRSARHAERWEAWITARGKHYDVCVAVYLQAVADAMKNPAFTESAGLWLREQAKGPVSAH